MSSELYEVWINDDKVAIHMSRDIALLLIDAIFSKYYNEPNLSVIIRREELCAEAKIDD